MRHTDTVAVILAAGQGKRMKSEMPKVLHEINGKILVLCGDMPLVSVNSLEKLLLALDEEGVPAAVLTGELEDPQEYGRVIKTKNGYVDKIVEYKDANPKEKKVKEVSSGTFCFEARTIFPILEQVTADNAQQEYYLTDMVKILKEQGKK